MLLTSIRSHLFSLCSSDSIDIVYCYQLLFSVVRISATVSFHSRTNPPRLLKACFDFTFARPICVLKINVTEAVLAY